MLYLGCKYSYGLVLTALGLPVVGLIRVSHSGLGFRAPFKGNYGIPLKGFGVI